MPRHELKTLYVGPDHCVALCGNLMIFVALDDPQPSVVRLLPGFIRTLKAQAPGPIGFLVVLPPDNPPPKEEARKTIKDVFNLMNEGMSFGAMAIEMTGFAAAGQRSVVNLILLAVRPKIPVKMFGSVEEAGQWMNTKQGREAKVSVAELVETVKTLARDYRAGSLRVSL
jgi:hypothetical protein